MTDLKVRLAEMKITRDVIIDLLPVYIGEEASDDTKQLVREYLETDPALAEMAKNAADMRLPEDVPVPLTWEDKMDAYKEARRLMLIRTIMLSGIISVSVLALLGLGAVVVMFFVR
jgi:hypothetical protein